MTSAVVVGICGSVTILPHDYLHGEALQSEYRVFFKLCNLLRSPCDTIGTAVQQLFFGCACLVDTLKGALQHFLNIARKRC